MRVTVGDDEVI